MFVVNKNFAIPIPEAMPLEKAGPIFCAGITLYHPLKVHGATSGNKKVAIIGLGGLGMMGLKLAVAMGNEVSVISTTESKKEGALSMGAKNFIVSTKEGELDKWKNSFDIVLDCISCHHSVQQYQTLLRNKGALVLLGLIVESTDLCIIDLLGGDKKVCGSQVGGIQDTIELINLCTEKKIYPETQIINANQLDEVYNTLSSKNDTITR